MGKRLSAGARNLFLGLALLAGGMGGTVLCIATMLLRKSLLPGWLAAAYALAGGGVALVFLTLYLCLASPSGKNALGRIRSHWLDVLGAELWLAAIYGLWKFLDGIWDQRCDRYLLGGTAHIGGRLLLQLGALLAANLFLRRLLKVYLGGAGVLSFLLTFAGLAAGADALWAASQLWDKIAGFFAPTVPAALAGCLFRICCVYGILWAGRFLLCRRGKTPGDAEAASGEASEETAGEPPEESSGESEEKMSGETSEKASGEPSEEAPEEPSEKFSGKSFGKASRKFSRKAPEQAQKPLSRRLIGAGIPLVLILFPVGWDIFFAPPSAVELASAAVEAPAATGYASYEKGELAEALRQFALAEGRFRAFQSLKDENPMDALRVIYAEYPEDAVIGALYLSGAGGIGEIQEALLGGSLGSEWYPALLRYYSGQEGLSPVQWRLRDELLLRCAGAGQYTAAGCVFAQDLKREELEKLDYRETLGMGGALELAARHEAAGGYTEEMAYRALELAEASPDSLLLQYLACQAGAGYRVDGALHYGRTLEAAARFDGLYRDDWRTDGQMAAAKRFLGGVAADCDDYKAAAGYYREAYEFSPEAGLALVAAECYEKSKDYGQCLRTVQEVLEKEPENPRALYLKAISSLKTEDVEGALEAAGRLGDLLADPGRGTGLAEESLLYACAQYFSMSDSSQWTDFTWKIYSSLSEEQIDAVKSHALLWDYMTAISQCFMQKDFPEAERAVEEILAVREDLPMAWYLRGTVAFSQKDFKRALSYFEQSLGYGGGEVPAVYFSIANTYDAMGDDENAYAYAKRVEEMLPYLDHGSDVYGISYHNEKLLEALKEKLGR